MNKEKEETNLQKILYKIIYLVLMVFVFIGLLYFLNYLGVVEFSSDKKITIPGTDIELVLTSPCLDKKIEGDFLVSFQKYQNEEPFFNQMIPRKIFHMQIKKEKCEIVGEGYQKAIGLFDARTSQTIEQEILFTVPARLSGSFNNDTINLKFNSLQGGAHSDIWQIMCIDSNPNLDRFSGIIIDELLNEIGRVYFEKYDSSSTKFAEEKIEEKVQRGVTEKAIVDSIDIGNQILEEKLLELEHQKYFLLPSFQEQEIQSAYSIQIAAKSRPSGIINLINEYKGILGGKIMVFRTRENKNMYKLLIGAFEDYEEATNLKNMLNKTFPHIGELENAWLVFSDELYSKN